MSLARKHTGAVLTPGPAGWASPGAARLPDTQLWADRPAPPRAPARIARGGSRGPRHPEAVSGPHRAVAVRASAGGSGWDAC